MRSFRGEFIIMYHKHRKNSSWSRDRSPRAIYCCFTLFILSVYSTMFPIGLCNPLAANFCFVNSAIQAIIPTFKVAPRSLKLYLLRYIDIIPKVKSLIRQNRIRLDPSCLHIQLQWNSANIKLTNNKNYKSWTVSENILHTYFSDSFKINGLMTLPRLNSSGALDKLLQTDKILIQYARAKVISQTYTRERFTVQWSNKSFWVHCDPVTQGPVQIEQTSLIKSLLYSMAFLSSFLKWNWLRTFMNFSCWPIYFEEWKKLGSGDWDIWSTVQWIPL